jgi:hypothetical protein
MSLLPDLDMHSSRRRRLLDAPAQRCIHGSAGVLVLDEVILGTINLQLTVKDSVAADGMGVHKDMGGARPSRPMSTMIDDWTSMGNRSGTSYMRKRGLGRAKHAKIEPSDMWIRIDWRCVELLSPVRRRPWCCIRYRRYIRTCMLLE